MIYVNGLNRFQQKNTLNLHRVLIFLEGTNSPFVLQIKTFL